MRAKYWVVAIIIVFVVLMALIFIGYRSDWTGFNGYTQVTVAHTTSGPSVGTVVRTEVYQPGKALWDWMQLLIIPVVLVVGGFWLNDTTSRTEREIALDNQREAALQAYFDKMSELLLKGDLYRSQPRDEKRGIARARTLTVLHHLGNTRKKSVLQFLWETRLIRIDKQPEPIVDLGSAEIGEADLSWIHLEHADLAGVLGKEAKLSHAYLFRAKLWGAHLDEAKLGKSDLRFANLREVNFSGADLSEADLSGAELYETNLSKANLSKAYLSEANLSGANLSGANLDGANLHDAKYNTKAMQKKDWNGQPIFGEQGKPVMIEPTQWPQGFDAKAAGAICVDC